MLEDTLVLVALPGVIEFHLLKTIMRICSTNIFLPFFVLSLLGATHVNPLFGQRFIFDAQKFFPTDYTESAVGQSVAYLGNFFGDDLEYIAFGEPDAAGGGAVWLVALDQDREFKSNTKRFRIPERPGDIEGLEDNDDFGASIALLEDVDGNGIPELAIGAPQDDDGGINAGAVYILYLNDRAEINLATKVTEDQSGFTMPLNTSDQFGASVAGVAGLAEENETILVVGAPGKDGGEGLIYGCFLEKRGVERCRSFSESSNSTQPQHYGSALVQIAPPDEQNLVSFGTGATRYVAPVDEGEFARNNGRVYLYALRVINNQISLLDRGFFQNSLNHLVGASLAAPGDLDGDGCNDLLSGGPQNFTGGFAPGHIYLLFLSCSTSLLASTQQSLDPGDSPLQTLRGGTSLAAVPVPGKENVTILTGTPGDNTQGAGTGAFQHLTLFNPLPPIAVNDVISVTEDTPVLLSTIFDNDLLNDRTPHTVERGNTFGRGTIDPMRISTDEAFTYTPAKDMFGALTLTYRLGDDRFASIFDSPYTVGFIDVTITPAEDLPKIDNLDSLRAPAGMLYNQTVSVREVDGDPLSVQVLKKPDWLASAISGDDTETIVTFIGTPSLTDVGDHEIVVFADDGKGTSTESYIITVTAQMLATPTLIEPVDNASDLSLNVEASWQAVAGATGYLVQLSTSEDFSRLVLNEMTPQISTTFNDLLPATTYFWRLQATAPNASGAFSDAFSFTTTQVDPNSILAAPQLLAPSDGSVEQATILTLAWQAIDGATQYRIQVSQDTTFATTTVDTVVVASVVQLENLAPGTTYRWRVQGQNDASAGPFSDPFEFTTAFRVAVDAGETPRRFRLDQNHPNPFNPQTVIRYELSEAGPVRLTVYDMLGREVRTLVDRHQAAGAYDVVFEAGPLPSGIYIYRLVASDRAEIATRRMVLLR